VSGNNKDEIEKKEIGNLSNWHLSMLPDDYFDVDSILTIQRINANHASFEKLMARLAGARSGWQFCFR